MQFDRPEGGKPTAHPGPVEWAPHRDHLLRAVTLGWANATCIHH